jgi:hypothetical protein
VLVEQGIFELHHLQARDLEAFALEPSEYLAEQRSLQCVRLEKHKSAFHVISSE